MIKLNQTIEALSLLHEDIKKNIDTDLYQNVISKARANNPWFEENNIRQQLLNFLPWLDTTQLQHALMPYHLEQIVDDNNKNQQTIGVICAGNIPMVGFHDILCVLLSGKKLYCKLSSKDDILIPFLIDRLEGFLPEIKNKILSISSQTKLELNKIDAVITSSTDSAAVLFENYFKGLPHIIRKSRYSVAVLTNEDNIDGLEDDILMYFGLGCRNVSCVYVPEGFDLTSIHDRLQKYSYFLDHNKYRNNYDYHKAIFIMNNIAFKDFSPMLLRQDKEIFSPISVLNYFFYKDGNHLNTYLLSQKNNLQCIVANKFPLCKELQPYKVSISQAQQPSFTTFADQIDTLQFLQQL